MNLRGSYQARYPDVPWAQLAGLRNRLVHAYFDLNLPLLWNIAYSGSGRLEAQFRHILELEFPGATELSL